MPLDHLKETKKASLFMPLSACLHTSSLHISIFSLSNSLLILYKRYSHNQHLLYTLLSLSFHFLQVVCTLQFSPFLTAYRSSTGDIHTLNIYSLLYFPYHLILCKLSTLSLSIPAHTCHLTRHAKSSTCTLITFPIYFLSVMYKLCSGPIALSHSMS